jgi:hypothetical protein
MGRSLSLLVVITLLIPVWSRAQCSDGGVCTLGASDLSTAHGLSLQWGYGKSPSAEGLTYRAVQIGAELRVFENIGDLIVVWTQSLVSASGSRLDAQLGGRFATADVNAGGLPQKYQSGLGTNDLLLGLNYARDAWEAGIGYQLSRGRSDNAPTRLKRGDDLMLRGGYSAKVSDFLLRGEILAIKRLQLSSVRDTSTTSPEAYTTIPDSDQLQINILADIQYHLSPALSLNASAAIPLLEREINVDGLSRSFTLSVGVTAAF